MPCSVDFSGRPFFLREMEKDLICGKGGAVMGRTRKHRIRNCVQNVMSKRRIIEKKVSVVLIKGWHLRDLNPNFQLSKSFWSSLLKVCEP